MNIVTYPNIFGWGTLTHSGDINLSLDTDLCENAFGFNDFNTNDVSVFWLPEANLAAFETVTNDKFKHNTIKHSLVKLDALLVTFAMVSC